MPKLVTYSKDAILFFEGDRDLRIFVIQSGEIKLTSIDIESGCEMNEFLKAGEFIGVKSALANKPRTETATAVSEVKALLLSVAEFEALVGKNQTLVLKMLNVFSRNLRELHKKTEAILKTDKQLLNPEDGMFLVAKAFSEEENHASALSVCTKLLDRFPHAANAAAVNRLLESSKIANERKQKAALMEPEVLEIDPAEKKTLAQFSLPMFERFSKLYKPGDVIMTEYEPGDTFYLIQSGHVQIEKYMNNTLKNIDIIKPGEFFGEMAILDNSPRSATCVAKTEVKCLEFNKENFAVLVTANPQIAMLLIKIFCKRIYDQRRKFGILLISDSYARVADVFLMFDETNSAESLNSSKNYRRKFFLTIKDVAHWASISVEEADDVMKRYAKAHKIEIFDKYVTVANIMDMKRTVDSYFAGHKEDFNKIKLGQK